MLVKNTVTLFLLIFVSLPINSLTNKGISIIPQPNSIINKEGRFILSKETPIVVRSIKDTTTAVYFNEYLKKYYGFELLILKKGVKGIILSTNAKKGSKDGYTFNSDNQKIIINGNTSSGTFYGIQTLIQLLPIEKCDQLVVPAVSIKDEPAFKYRGMHLDVCRHFFPVDYIKRYIDYIALHKMNYFHWHLTEDQGWRIEIKKYSKLTSVGAWRNGTIIGLNPGNGNDCKQHGGFYTQAQIKEIVAYATKRYVTVIPEIEMPGHASAAIASYPFLSCFPEKFTKITDTNLWCGSKEGKQVIQSWGVFEDVFCAGKETTFEFIENVLDEIIPLFPSEFIHVGGDECPKTHWKKCPLCQQKMKSLGLKNEHELQSYFVHRIEKYLNKKGKKIIGWDEILEGGLAPNAIVMSWQGEQGGVAASKQNHQVIMCPWQCTYLNYQQSAIEDTLAISGNINFIPIDTVYNWKIIPTVLDKEKHKYILGGQVNVWTEYIPNRYRLEYMAFPRMAALSENFWTKIDSKNLTDFKKRLNKQLKRYDMWDINYFGKLK